jgi:UDP-N-acetylmuramoyl-tripeptide--D-alanyl-D-alanine ligase
MLFAFGPNSGRVISGAVTGGMTDRQVDCYEDREKLVAALKRTVKPGDVLLFKGSHGMRLDLVLEQMLRDE